jgi:Cu/Ag efflux protein CusF
VDQPRGTRVALSSATAYRQRRFEMMKVVALTFALLLGLSMAAWAGEVAGKIQAVDSAERVITLEDGTKLWVAEGISIDSLKEGVKVTASYEERDGKNVVTSIDVE